MGYKCLECGHIFEDGEQANWVETHGFIDGRYEHFSGCPICKGAYEETVRCKHCGSECLKDELYDGFCEECLRNFATYDRALDFLIESEILSIFMFEKVWESSEPHKVSDKLKVVLREFFLRRKVDELLCGKTEFLNLCKKYILDDDGEFGKQNFAEWLNKKGVK